MVSLLAKLASIFVQSLSSIILIIRVINHTEITMIIPIRAIDNVLLIYIDHYLIRKNIR